MKKWKLLYIWIAVSLIWGSALLLPESAKACSCAEITDIGEAKNNSDAVFDGTVIGKKGALKLFNRSSADPVEWTFKVNEVWKGKVAPTITVQSAEASASCGFKFQDGQRYIVYAHQTGDSLDVSLCSRTAQHSAAGQDIAELGQGSVPPQAPETSIPASSGLWWILSILAIVVVASVIFIKLIHKKPPSTKSKI